MKRDALLALLRRKSFSQAELLGTIKKTPNTVPPEALKRGRTENPQNTAGNPGRVEDGQPALERGVLNPS